jgi:hypothetical protein
MKPVTAFVVVAGFLLGRAACHKPHFNEVVISADKDIADANIVLKASCGGPVRNS